MNLKATLLTTLLATSMIAASAAVALADPPSMRQDADIYSAPGGQVIDSIDSDEDVSVGQCRGGYCYVRDLEDPDTKGWVKSATINIAGSGDDDDTANASPVMDNGSLIDLDTFAGEDSDEHPHKHK